jgi:DNA-binding winged helix-turn-helix (wHTH) protein
MRVTFGPFAYDAQTRQLLRGDRPLHLSPKAFDLLAALVEQRPAAVSKDVIHQKLWPDSFVSDGSLAVLVAELRGALGDDARHPVIVRTLHRFGYAFAASAVEAPAPAAAVTEAPASTQCWLTCDNERAPLMAGDNVVGRDPGVQVRIGLDAAADLRIEPAGVSRRHALVVVADGEAFLHDLSSKNGTFADEVRVTRPVQLSDGTGIRLASVSLHFRRLTEARTETQDASPR